MTKKITAIIGKDGKPVFDFSGFTGDSCYSESEKVWGALSNLGLKGTAEHVEGKDAELQVNQEEQLETN